MSSGPYKIAMGVIVVAMGVAILPTVGGVAILQILAGGLLIYMGAKKLERQIQAGGER